MKKFFLLLALLFCTSDAFAAARFWVGGTGNWDGVDTTHWSASSGGASGASAPGASDDVTFDGSSGGGTVTVTATVTVNSITSGAHTGTIDTNGQTINTGSWSGTGSATRTLTFGASAINVSGTGTVWNFATSTNLTLNPGTSTITLSGASVTFDNGSAAASKTYYAVSFTGSGSATYIGTSVTNLTRTGTAAKTDQFLIGSSPQTVSGTLTINGNSSVNRMLFRSSTLGTSRTMTVANLSMSNLDIRDITGAGAASWNLSAITGNSGDCGGNSGITFTTAADQHWISASGGNWSDVTKWTSRVPLPQDNVYFDNAFSASQTVTADMPRLGKSIDWTGASGSPTVAWNGSSTVTNYGSLTLISGMTNGTSGTFIFEGRSSFTLTTAGKGLCAITSQMFGGTLTLQDAVSSVATQWTQTNGTLATNNFNFTAPIIFSSGSVARGLNAGSSVITLSGTGTVLNISTSTNFTMSAGTSTILISDISASSKTFAGGGLTYNDLQIAGGGAGAIILTGANTFNRIYTDGGGTKSITLPGSTTTTIISGDGLGNGTNVITFTASSGSATVAKSGGGTVGWDYVNLTNIPASTANTWYAGTHSTNGGGNTNWSFTDAPPSGSLLNYPFPYQRKSDIR